MYRSIFQIVNFLINLPRLIHRMQTFQGRLYDEHQSLKHQSGNLDTIGGVQLGDLHSSSTMGQ